MSVFKEKKGTVWIFETKVGYAGIRRPDISIVEPLMLPPSFDSRIQEPTEPLQRSARSRLSANALPAFETLLTLLGPRG